MLLTIIVFPLPTGVFTKLCRTPMVTDGRSSKYCVKRVCLHDIFYDLKTGPIDDNCRFKKWSGPTTGSGLRNTQRITAHTASLKRLEPGRSLMLSARCIAEEQDSALPLLHATTMVHSFGSTLNASRR